MNIAKFDCNDCDKKFKYKTDLILHHEGEHQKLNLPYEICGKRFKDKWPQTEKVRSTAITARGLSDWNANWRITRV